MMDHDARSDPRRLGIDAGADRGDDPARLVPGDDGIGVDRQPAAGAARFRPAVLVQVAAAHPRRLHLDDDFARTRRRIGKVHQFELALAGEDNPAHDIPPCSADQGRWSLRSFAAIR
jgi:hypothetical protein